MKVNLDKLMEQNNANKKQTSYEKIVKGSLYCMLCLMFIGIIIVYQSVVHKENVSADTIYDESEANPSFIVQHVGDIEIPDIQPGDGDMTVLVDNEIYHAGTNNEHLSTITKRVSLYDDYETDWNTTNSIELASFLNGDDGLHTNGYTLKEIWFGDNADSDNQSDFLTLSVPDNLSDIILTNNSDHPKLSEASGGYYTINDDGKYVICIEDNDVIRLVFESLSCWESYDVNVFDYDVSDGGYYLEDDYFHRNNKHDTSGINNEKGTIYVDTIENGIHLPENYSGDGAKLAFGGAGIGTDMADEFIDNELNTLNVWNYSELSGMGITKGLISGVSNNGDVIWSDKVSVPDLFGVNETEGKTDYIDGKYSFTFNRNGFNKTLSAVESEYGTSAENLEMFNTSFWILDTAPSCGTDGHDPMWGSGSDKIQHYRSNDRAPEAFGTSDDNFDHDNFFGFSYTEDFVLSPGYTGPLNFFGCCDDDMWVFVGRVDDDGNVMSDTVVPVADLGGVHDKISCYCDLWNVIDKIEYGESAQNWWLFVFWLERDGISANCYMSFTLPENVISGERTTNSIMVEANSYKSVKENVRTFLFDDDTHNKYHGTYSDGNETIIVSGQEFEITDGMFITIDGIDDESTFTIKETGRKNVWHSSGCDYVEGDEVTSTLGTMNMISFLSTDNSGTLSITANADNTPDSGYSFKLSLHDTNLVEVSAMDGHNNPMGSRFTDNNGEMVITIKAGETLILYDLPEGTEFTLEPVPIPGYRVAEIMLDDGSTSGASVTGTFPAYVVYRYEEKELKEPIVFIEQSVGDNFSDSDIILGTGTLLSYKISVENINDVPIDISIEDLLPDGLEIVESSVTGGVVDEQNITWDIDMEAESVMELSFTCKVMADDAQIFDNNISVTTDDNVINSNTVTAVIP